MRTIGTTVRGVRCPVIRQGDDLLSIVVDSVMEASVAESIAWNDRDIVAVTEAVVARAQGNYATVDQIAKDVRAKFGGGTIGVTFPILSRNRFSVCLKGMARGAEKIVLLLSYPSDEVGNHLFDEDLLDEQGVNPWTDVLNEETYRQKFGYGVHPFTGVDYVKFYKELIQSEDCAVEVVFSNDVRTILDYTNNVLCCDIHTRNRNKKRLQKAGAKLVLTMDDMLNAPVDGSGYNEHYGLLGSNKATEESVKLFPNHCGEFVDGLQARLAEATGKNIEVLVYGDGAFKDPMGKIWELADPVVSPAYTLGLAGTPNEIKLKYLADNDFSHLQGEELAQAIREQIVKKEKDLVGSMASEGTTPRQLTDLIGSLCDLTSGSGDKGTPIVWIQGYFDNYAI